MHISFRYAKNSRAGTFTNKIDLNPTLSVAVNWFQNCEFCLSRILPYFTMCVCVCHFYYLDYLDQPDHLDHLDHLNHLDHMDHLDHLDQIDPIDHPYHPDHLDQTDHLDHLDHMGHSGQ